MSRFDSLADEWAAHLVASADSSNPAVYVRSPAFEGLVELGKAAVPQIIERYREGSLFWGAALARITGMTEFGDGLVGDLDETRRLWLEWYDGQK